MMALASRCSARREGEPAMRAAQQLFGFSILYLFLLFAALLAEHGLGLCGRARCSGERAMASRPASRL